LRVDRAGPENDPGQRNENPHPTHTDARRSSLRHIVQPVQLQGRCASGPILARPRRFDGHRSLQVRVSKRHA
jgi:hypothetical protein